MIPEVQLLGFDSKRGTFQKKFVYHVSKYDAYNTKDPNAVIMAPTQVVKDYQYIYTGKNSDILDFTLEFNALYFTALQASPQNTESLNQNPGNQANATNNTQSQASGSIQPNMQQSRAGDLRTTSGGSYGSSEMVTAKNVANNLYSVHAKNH